MSEDDRAERRRQDRERLQHAAERAAVLGGLAALGPCAREQRAGEVFADQPADYWGSESWRHIAPAYEVAVAREPGGGVCWDIEDGPAAVIAILASLVGLAAIGIAMANIRRWRRPAVAALAAGLPPAVLWSIAGIFQALSALE